MKKIFLVFTILFTLTKSSISQTILDLPDNLSKVIIEQIQINDANGNVLNKEAQDNLINKLNVLQSNLNNTEKFDYENAKMVSEENIKLFQESELKKFTDANFSDVKSITDIYSKCKELMKQKLRADEYAYVIWLSYSIQMEQEFESRTNINGKRVPCTAINYLESAGIGFALCGPWCGTITLLIVAFHGCGNL